MKITARFYSVDDAEFAAAAIRRNGSGIFDITINERSTGAGRDGTFAPMGFFFGDRLRKHGCHASACIWRNIGH